MTVFAANIKSHTLNQINGEIDRTAANIQEIELNLGMDDAISGRQKLSYKERRKVLVKILNRLKKMAKQIAMQPNWLGLDTCAS